MQYQLLGVDVSRYGVKTTQIFNSLFSVFSRVNVLFDAFFPWSNAFVKKYYSHADYFSLKLWG